MKVALFLDDERYPAHERYAWVIVRNFEEAVRYFETNPCPEFISLDHDLGDKDAKTGYDFVKWLCEQDMNNPGFIPKDFSFTVHSMNPVGAANMKAYLSAYLEIRPSEFEPPVWSNTVTENYDGDF